MNFNEDQENSTEVGPIITEDQGPPVDMAKVEAFLLHAEAQQNLPMGILGGVIASLVGAGIWAVITVVTEYQIGWMAIGVGLLCGFAVRYFGKGLSTSFGIVGATCALFGCLLGNLLSICGFIASGESLSFLEVFGFVLQQPGLIVDLMVEHFMVMDLLFYGFAVFEGFKFSFRQITSEELVGLNPDEIPQQPSAL